ncbi:hypothetical protein VUR80DRAFT_8019 [Thermomyces stellatus]
MSTTFTRRLLAAPGIRSAIGSTLPARISPFLVRSISSTAANSDDNKTTASNLFSRTAQPDNASPGQDNKGSGSGAMANLTRVLGPDAASDGEEASLASLTKELQGRTGIEEEPYHFHVYSHKHNTHITVTKPNRDAIISLSCGNIGFRKARRKQYDAAYQLTVYVLERLYDAGWDNKIEQLEVVLRGFGTGREAATKVLLGSEGTRLRNKIVRVSDATRIKFGGTRSKNPRRV